jgi:hypothetical protein
MHDICRLAMCEVLIITVLWCINATAPEFLSLPAKNYYQQRCQRILSCLGTYLFAVIKQYSLHLPLMTSFFVEYGFLNWLWNTLGN